MFIFINTLSVFAGPGKTTYQAKIIKPDGYPLEVSSVNFKFTILDPAGSCVLYSETYSSVNMSSTGGLISFALGSGVKTYPASATTFEQVFSNIAPSLSCDTGGPVSYSPSANDIRKIVMQFHDGSGWQTLPAMSINAVPYAMYANEATKLNGLTSSDFVQLSTVPTCTASEALRYTGASFTCVAVGNSVTSSTVITALGYTPADGASVTALSSNVSSVSSTVFSVSSTVTSLQNSVAASFAAITSSQWTTSGTSISYSPGNVGVGTTNPSAKLHIEQSSTTAPDFRIVNSSTNTGISLDANWPGVQFNTYHNGANDIAIGSGYSGVMYLNPLAGDIGILTGNNPGDGNSVSMTERFTIKNNGNVGIGTTTPVTKLDVSGGVRIGAESTTCAPALAGTLRYNASNVEYCNGTSWQAFGVSGAGITNFNGSTSGTQSFTTGTGGTAPNFNTSNGVHTLNIPFANTGSVTAGLISNTDYTTFTNKITSSAASIAQVLGYVPADNAASGTYAQKANNLSDLTNVATARTNLGLGTFATASSIDLGSASATGTLAIARLPSFTGDATIAAASNTIILSNSGVTAGTYTKVTVDSKGRVTSSAALASSDVTTALGYTPANSATTVSSQWNTSGTTINYMTGNVGIGTTDPGTSKTKIYGTGAINNKLLEVVADGVGGGQTGPFYAGYFDSIPNNSATDGYGVYAKSAGSTGHRYGIYGQAEVGSSWIDSYGVYGKAIYNSAAVNGKGVGIYADATTTGTTLNAKTYGAYITNSTVYAAISYGAFINATAGPTTVIPLAVASNNVEKFRIDSNGNVGIGTTNPQRKLDVAGEISAQNGYGSTFYIGGDSSGDDFEVGSLTASKTTISFYNRVDATYMDIIARNATLSGSLSAPGFRVTSDGKVGVGTTTPTAELHLAAGTSTLAPFKFTSGTLLTSPQSGTMEYDGTNFYLTDSTNTRRAIAANANPGTYDNVSNINSSGNITLTPTGSVVVSSTTASTNSSTGALVVKGGLGVAGNIYTSGTIVTSSNIQGVSVTATSGMISPYIAGSVASGGSLTLDSTTHATKGNILLAPSGGNVGIGTTTPQAHLHIDKSAATEMLVGPAGASTLALGNRDSVAATLNGGTGAYSAIVGANGELRFGLVGHSTPSTLYQTHMFIGSTGDVGIGTVSPQAYGSNYKTLEVKGGLTTTGGIFQSSTSDSSVKNRMFIDSSLGYFGTSTNHSVAFQTNGAERVRIDTAGNVGIGTTTPTTNLEVKTSTVDTSSTALRLTSSDLAFAANQELQMDFNQATATTARIAMAYFNPDWGLNFYGYNGGLSPTPNMTIRGDGNVGIGTASPGAKLEVNDGANTSLQIIPSGGVAELRAINKSGGYYSARYDATQHIWSVAGTEKIRIDTTGNLGIGTTSPQSKLHIEGGGQLIRGASGSSTSLELITNSNAVGTGLRLGQGYATATDSTVWIENLSNAPMIFRTNATARMTIDGSGKVGIGTTTPSYKLEVVDGTTAGLRIATASSTVGSPQIDLFDSSRGIETVISSFDGTTAGTYIASYSNSPLMFGTNAAVTPTNKMILTAAGNVGIGTITPSEKLEVNGFVKAQGFKTSAMTVGTELLYVRGTGLNNNASRLVKLGNQTLVDGSARGLTLTIITASTHTHVSSTNYDVYGSTIDSDNLATALNNLTRDKIGVLSSYDSWEGNLTANLRTAARRLGLYKLAVATEYRAPYAAIFYGAGIATNNTEVGRQAYEILQNGDADSSYALLTTWLTEDGFVGQNLTNVLMSGNPNTADPVVLVNSSGNVGIGTTAPAARFHVEGAGGTVNDGLIIRSTTGGNQFGFYTSLNDFHLRSVTGGANVLTATYGGNVGIGTSAPTSKLSIYSGNDGSMDSIQIHGGAVSASRYGIINVHDTSEYIRLGYYNGTTMKNIFLDGNVGLGTASPGLKLQSQGSIGINIGYPNMCPSMSRDSGGLILAGSQSTDCLTGWYYGGRIVEKDYGDGLNMEFDTAYGGVWTNNALVISGRTGKQGFVGIGVTAPTYQLQLSTDSAAKPGTSTWTIASDVRLKDIRAPFTRGLDALNGLHTVYFNYKQDNPLGLPSAKEYVGIRAQDALKVIPEAVSQDEKGYYHVTNDSIIWTVVNAVKELYRKFIDHDEQLVQQARALAAVQEENKKLKNENAEKTKQLSDIRVYLCAKDPNAPICK